MHNIHIINKVIIVLGYLLFVSLCVFSSDIFAFIYLLSNKISYC